MYTTNAEFNGHSYAIYRNEILQSQTKDIDLGSMGASF